VPQGGLSHVTLRFCDSAMEAGFMQCRNGKLLDHLCSMAVVLLTTLLISIGVLVARLCVENYNDDGLKVGYTSVVILAVACVMSMITVVWCNSAWVRTKSTPLANETFAMVVVMIVTMLVCISHGHYLGRIFGHSNTRALHAIDGKESVMSDSYVVLAIATSIAGSHAGLPVRSYIMLATELGGPVLYVLLAIYLGSPEGLNVVYNLMLLVFLSVASASGMRRVEYHERFQFATVVEQKKMRCVSEFHLSRLVRPPADNASIDSMSFLNSESSPSAPTVMRQKSVASIASSPVDMQIPGSVVPIRDSSLSSSRVDMQPASTSDLAHSTEVAIQTEALPRPDRVVDLD